MMSLSVVWVIVAQAQMGASWRVGIDQAVPTEMVHRGLFRVSRNPIFLGMMAQLTGLFLVHPDAIMLVVLAAAYLLISVQIRQEELHLSAAHGDKYARYCSQVRRWS